jgi:hypothetical protein
VRNRPWRKVRTSDSRFRKPPPWRAVSRLGLLVVLLETPPWEDAVRHRVRLALPGDGPDLVIAGLVAPGQAREDGYMAIDPYTRPYTILKVTHHGSNTSSTPLFLSRFPPRIAVIQVGADNPYGHPTPETLDRLRRTGAKVFRNEKHRDVIVTIIDEKVDVAATKPEAAF